jgi:hypothetical protein
MSACFNEDLPPATLPETEKVLELMLERNRETAEDAALLAATIRVDRLYLERALEGVRNAGKDNDERDD